LKEIITLNEDENLKDLIIRFRKNKTNNEIYTREVIEDQRETIYKEYYTYYKKDTNQIYELKTINYGYISELTPTNFKSNYSKIKLHDRRNTTLNQNVVLTALYVVAYGFQTDKLVLELDNKLVIVEQLIDHIKDVLPNHFFEIIINV